MNLKLKLDVPFVALTKGCGSGDRTIVLGSSKNDNWYSRFWINVQDFTVDGPKVTNVDEMIKKHYKLSFSNWKEVRKNIGSSVFYKYKELCPIIRFRLFLKSRVST